MPEKRRYKCLNSECPGPGSRNFTEIFVAMNNEAVCPACGCIKLQEWGEAGFSPPGWERVSGARTSHLKQSDTNLRRIAERYGMTNMSNKDGKGVKANQAAEASGPTTKVGGIDIPISQLGSCVNVPTLAKSLNATWTGAGAPQKGMPGISGMTNVVGNHE